MGASEVLVAGVRKGCSPPLGARTAGVSNPLRAAGDGATEDAGVASRPSLGRFMPPAA